MMDLEDGSSHGWGEHDLKVLLAEEILCPPSTGMKTTISIEEETLLQESAAADWELNDYYDEGLSLGLHAELEEASQLTGDLMDHFWKFYERGVNYILLHYDGNSRYAYETIRSIMEEGALNQVISDGEFIVIVSDFFVGGEDVTFRFFDGERLVEYEGISDPVPYSQIREYDCCLDPALYVEGDVEDGYSLVPLGELCEVDEDSMEEFVSDPKTYFALPRYHFSSDLQETFNDAYAPKQHRVSLSSDVYKGPHVHVNARGGLFLNRAPGYYMCPDEKNWALRIKDDIISPEYLTYVLNYDRRLHYILSTITPSISMLLKHKVRVLNERSRQQELVAEYLENTSPVVNSVEV
jgi:hypothetical protein